MDDLNNLKGASVGFRGAAGSDDFAVVLTGDGIKFYELVQMRGRLSLEIKGLKSRGRSASSHIRNKWGIRGNRTKQLAVLDEHIKRIKSEASDSGSCTECTTGVASMCRDCHDTDLRDVWQAAGEV